MTPRRSTLSLAALFVAGGAVGFGVSRLLPRTADVASGSSAESAASPERGEAESPSTGVLAAQPGAKAADAARTTLLLDVAELERAYALSSKRARVWPEYAKELAEHGKAEEAAQVFRAALAAGVAPVEIQLFLAEIGDESARLAVVERLRRDGVPVYEDPRAWEQLLAYGGRGEDVLKDGLAPLATNDPREFRGLVDGAFRRKVEVAALLDLAAKEPWPAWKIDEVLAALNDAGRGAEAQKWAPLRDRVAAAEAKAEREGATHAIDEALDAARSATEPTESAADAWVTLGNARRDAGDLAGAADAYDRALSLFPYHHDAAESLGRIDPARAIARVEAPLRAGATAADFDLLFELYVRARRAKDAASLLFAGPQWDSQSAALDDGFAMLAPEAALPLIEARLARSGKSGVLLRWKADALRALGRRTEAVDCLVKAIDLGAESCHWRLVELDPAATVARLSPLSVADGAEFDKWAYLGEAHRRLGQLDEAKACAQRHIAASEDWLDDAEADWIAAADPETRLPMLRKRAEAEPADAHRWLRLGCAYECLGDRAQARDAFDRALKADPTEYEALRRWTEVR